jgi:nucleotide-binding universal stress UspA family protein
MKMNFSKLLVPIKGISADDAAIRLACQIAKLNKARVTAIHVIEIQRNLPLDVENEAQLRAAELVLERAEEIAKPFHVAFTTEVLQARTAGVALVDEAIAAGVDLIVMGVPFRRVVGGEFELGATPHYVLQHAPCPVWLCREAITEETARAE